MSELKNQRLLSLDALRGFTIAAMVIVNDPGSWGHVYAPLLHADWHGITPTDLIFPFFLFMVGVSVTLAYTRRLEAGSPKGDMYKKIWSRAAKIMLLGWFLWLFPRFNFEGMRWVGVLPRISLVFLACALIFLNTNWKQQLYIAAGLLVGYWLLLALVPVPIDEVIRLALETGEVRSQAGQLAIGEIVQISASTIGANYEPGVNITAWLDRIVIPGRFWQYTWDPEGLMSTFPAIGTGIIGMLIGRLTLTISEPFKKVAIIFTAGFCMYLAGEMWGWTMPLNKNLWTSSYVLWTAGMSTMGLAACILVIDIYGYTKWTKLGRVYGANAITSYVLAGMLTTVFYYNLFGDFGLNDLWMDGVQAVGLSAKFASFTYAVLYMLVIYLPALWMYNRKIFIKV
jgi:predicted acyltransferase